MEAIETLPFSVGSFSLRRRSAQRNSLQSIAFLPNLSSFRRPTAPGSKSSLTVSAIKTPLPEGEVVGEDITQIFLRERQLNGDFVSKVSDMLWRRNGVGFVDSNTGNSEQDDQQHDYLKVVETEADDSGLLKLTKTKDWIYGNSDAPASRKARVKNWQDEIDKRKKLNFLKYEALKEELLLLTIGVGGACSAYCLIAFSFEYIEKHLPNQIAINFVIMRFDPLLVARLTHYCLNTQAAVSYASGVLFSCLYLQLLYYHADNLSREAVPGIFLQKKIKKIGVRSEDLKNIMEKTFNGTGVALSSPRLVIPATIYGLWALSQRFPNDYFDFQLVPAMFGFFAYKAAALIQVYRDNEGLRFVFPETEGLDSS